MGKEQDTLCILCQKSCTNGCSWSKSLIPVDGWEATETNNTNQSYFVIDCPQFVKETAQTILPSHIDDDGAISLIQAIVEQARYDYIHGIGIQKNKNGKKNPSFKDLAKRRALNRKEIEESLFHGDLNKLTHFTDHECNEFLESVSEEVQQYEDRLKEIYNTLNRGGDAFV